MLYVDHIELVYQILFYLFLYAHINVCFIACNNRFYLNFPPKKNKSLSAFLFR